ncbi:TetR/AcrR family transcriptional regulator [Devosia sp. CN2-171]|uniref:TetR/AcrR family transcriptional regulator n=1 Tax=Devosia sp. CN2-171 TaxID=3400909 RepID=UPI003BF7A74D
MEAGDAPNAEGLRERKHRETLRRIVESGMRLFTANGYEATTVDAIAAEAGISRRTFFHYFKTKDEILLSLQGVYDDAVAAAIAAQPPNLSPLEATRNAMLAVFATIQPEEMLVIDRLMRSSALVQASKQASYARSENVLFAALARRSQQPEMVLRLVAVQAVGVSRLAVEAWGKAADGRPITDFLREGFEALDLARSSR